MRYHVEVVPFSLFKSRKSGSFRVLVISNCQARYLAPLIEFALADCVCDYLICYRLGELDQHETIDRYLEQHKDAYQLILTLHLGPEWHAIGREALLSRFDRDRLFFIPGIYLRAPFPDKISLSSSAAQVITPMGNAHSKIALGGWLAGYSNSDIIKLYNTEIMEKMGFHTEIENSQQEFIRRESLCDTSFASSLFNIARNSFALYTENHPTPNLLAHFVNHIRYCLLNRGQARSSDLQMNAMLSEESLIIYGVWPIYEELKDFLKISHPITNHFIKPLAPGFEIISRDSFVERSIAQYNELGKEAIATISQAKEALTFIERAVR